MHNQKPTLTSLSPQAFATLQWLQEAGVTALVGDDFMPLVTVSTKSADVAPASSAPRAALAETRHAWAGDLAKCQDLNNLNQYLTGYKGLGLCLTATQAVLGQGQGHRPAIMVIAEAPDATEDQTGQPFSGAAHQMLQKAVFYARGDISDVYFTYLSKWRPPGQRSLSPPELELTQAILQCEIALVEPQHVITLSETTLRSVTKGLESWEKAEKLTIGPDQAASAQNIYSIGFNGENNKNNIKRWLLALQKPETMLRDSGIKKRVWLSLLAFCRTLTAST